MEGRTDIDTPQWYETTKKQNPKFYAHTRGFARIHIYVYRVLMHVQQQSLAHPTAPTVQCLDTYGEPKIERIKNARSFITRYPNDLIDGRLRIYILLYYIIMHAIATTTTTIITTVRHVVM